MTIVRFALTAASGVVVVGAMSLSPWSPRAATGVGLAGESLVTSAHAADPAHHERDVRSARSSQEIAVRYVTSGESSRARYRVRERLLGRELDNDAVGETADITGGIALDQNGAIVRSASGFDVKLTGLTSDETRRDKYVQSRILVTDSFPGIKLAVTGVRGLPSPLPVSGRVQFQLLGNLTLKRTTRSTTWNVVANVNGDRLTGTASTAFTFSDFQLTQPKVRVVLSVADTIRLEYEFAMRKQMP